MKALSRPDPSEARVVHSIRDALRRVGWTLVEKTHGNAFQAGWPDLYCFHRVYGHRWIEVKTPRGRLTKAQRTRFGEWEAAGESVWVLVSAVDIGLLHEAPNWRAWA